MDEERILILNMLRDGKITAEEAERLLSAMKVEAGAPQRPSSPRSPQPPFESINESQTRRQARQVGREMRQQAREASAEARQIAREARRVALEQARLARSEINRRMNDEEFRSVVDEVSEGVREGMRGLQEGLDVGLREGMRGLQEGMRGLREGLSGASDGMRDARRSTVGDVGRAAGQAAKSISKFSWLPGSDKCEARDEIERTIEVPAGTVLDLSSLNGDSKVVLWDEATIKIQAVKRAWGRTDSEARERLARIDLIAQVEGDRLLVKEQLPDGVTIGRPGSIDFVIYVPRPTALRLKSVNGDIDCREVVGRIDARTINGDLILGAVAEGDIGSTNGDLKVDSASRTLQVANVNGDVVIGLAIGQGATVTVRNVHGDIVAEFLPDAAALVEAGTRVGDIVTRREMSVEQRSSRRLIGRVGAGGGSVFLNTINGDVVIK